jgi:hypothetical protein
MSKVLNKVGVIMMFGLTAMGTAQARGIPGHFKGRGPDDC